MFQNKKIEGIVDSNENLQYHDITAISMDYVKIMRNIANGYDDYNNSYNRDNSNNDKEK